jgi:hypothetical protein
MSFNQNKLTIFTSLLKKLKVTYNVIRHSFHTSIDALNSEKIKFILLYIIKLAYNALSIFYLFFIRFNSI